MTPYNVSYNNNKKKITIADSDTLSSIYKKIQKQMKIPYPIVLEQNQHIIQHKKDISTNDDIIVRVIYIVLDLDETVLHSLHYDELDENKIHTEIFSKFMDDDSDEDNHYVVYTRPHVMKFMDYIFKDHRVIVWTAASEDYATWIIRNILSLSEHSNDPIPRNIELLLSGDHCDISHELSDKHKHLDLLYNEFKLHEKCPDSFDPSAIFILFDDSHSAQKGNIGDSPYLHRCVPIKPFELEEDGSFNTQDDILLQIIQNLQKNPEKMFSRTFSIN